MKGKRYTREREKVRERERERERESHPYPQSESRYTGRLAPRPPRPPPRPRPPPLVPPRGLPPERAAAADFFLNITNKFQIQMQTCNYHPLFSPKKDWSTCEFRETYLFKTTIQNYKDCFTCRRSAKEHNHSVYRPFRDYRPSLRSVFQPGERLMLFFLSLSLSIPLSLSHSLSHTFQNPPFLTCPLRGCWWPHTVGQRWCPDPPDPPYPPKKNCCAMTRTSPRTWDASEIWESREWEKCRITEKVSFTMLGSPIELEMIEIGRVRNWNIEILEKSQLDQALDPASTTSTTLHWYSSTAAAERQNSQSWEGKICWFVYVVLSLTIS